MTSPHSFLGWWVGEGREAPRRKKRAAGVRRFEIEDIFVYRAIEDSTIENVSRF